MEATGGHQGFCPNIVLLFPWDSISHQTYIEAGRQQAPEILLPPSPQSSGVIDVQPYLAFYVGTGDLNSQPHARTKITS